MNNKYKDIEEIINSVLSDTKVNYGYYGSSAFILKRVLWWKRIKIAFSLYKKYQLKINKKVLVDFGCEFGFLSAILSSFFTKVFLVDISKYNVDLGGYINQKVGSGNFEKIINSKENSSEFIGKIKDRVDLFIFLDVLEHIRNISELLVNLKKIMKGDTYLIISLPTENLLYNFLTKFKKEKDHVNRYYEVERALENNNYILVEKRNLFFLFYIYLYRHRDL